VLINSDGDKNDKTKKNEFIVFLSVILSSPHRSVVLGYNVRIVASSTKIYVHQFLADNLEPVHVVNKGQAEAECVGYQIHVIPSCGGDNDPVKAFSSNSSRRTWTLIGMIKKIIYV